MFVQALDDMEEMQAKRSNAGAIQDDEEETRRKEEQVNYFFVSGASSPPRLSLQLSKLKTGE